MNLWEHASNEGGKPCHLQRSEGAGAMGMEMLRCAQHDKGRGFFYCLKALVDGR